MDPEHEDVAGELVRGVQGGKQGLVPAPVDVVDVGEEAAARVREREGVARLEPVVHPGVEVPPELQRDLPRTLEGEEPRVGGVRGVQVLTVQPQGQAGRARRLQVDDRLRLPGPHPEGHRRPGLDPALGREDVEHGLDPLDVDSEGRVEKRRLGRRGGEGLARHGGGAGVGAGTAAGGAEGLGPESQAASPRASASRPGASGRLLLMAPSRVAPPSYARRSDRASVAGAGARADNGPGEPRSATWWRCLPPRAPRPRGGAGASRGAPPGRPGPTPVPLRFGVVAEEPGEPDRMLQVFAGLIVQLRERLRPLRVEVEDLVIARDLDDLSRKLARGDVDFVLETVFPTLVLQERSLGLEPSLVVLRRGQREYRSVFFARRDAPIRSLRDLKGRTLVLQVLRSTSAFALPKAELESAGLTLAPADDLRSRPSDVKYVLARAEINQAVWVLHGRGDAGAFHEGNWAALPGEGEVAAPDLPRDEADRAGPRLLPDRARRGGARCRRGRPPGDARGRGGPRRPGPGGRDHRLRAAHRRGPRGAPALGPRPAARAGPLMRLGGIGTRFAAWIAALALALVALALVAAGFIGFRQSRVVQAEIHDAVEAARSADEEAALRGAASYLGTHLFNALYQLDVERLDDEIAQTRSWLPVTSFLVIDRERRVLTDGTPENRLFGEDVSGELPEESAGPPADPAGRGDGDALPNRLRRRPGGVGGRRPGPGSLASLAAEARGADCRLVERPPGLAGDARAPGPSP